MVCSSCGFVAPPSLLPTLSSHLTSNLLTVERALGHVDGFVPLDDEGEFDLIGLRGDVDDEMEGGRTLLAGGGVGFGENGGARMTGTGVRKLRPREEYQERKKVSPPSSICPASPLLSTSQHLLLFRKLLTPLSLYALVPFSRSPSSSIVSSS